MLKALAKGDGVTLAQQYLGELQEGVSTAVADSGLVEELAVQSSAAAAQLGQLAESDAVKALAEQGLQTAAQLQEGSTAMLSQAASSEMLQETLAQGASLAEQAQVAAASAAEQTLPRQWGQQGGTKAPVRHASVVISRASAHAAKASESHVAHTAPQVVARAMCEGKTEEWH
eukprot:1624507-Amphidinium_carterae.1